MENPRRGSERGAVMAEFVIILPLLVIMLFAIIEFGIVYNRVQALHAAAREGARIASIRESTSGQVTTGITNALSGVTFDSGPSVALTPNTAKPCSNRPGQTVTVVLTATYNLDIPLVPGTTLNLTGNGSFRCE